MVVPKRPESAGLWSLADGCAPLGSPGNLVNGSKRATESGQETRKSGLKAAAGGKGNTTRKNAKQFSTIFDVFSS